MNEEFQHRQSAHCETGVISNLLREAGTDVSEPMVLGLSGGLTFAYIGFVKINGMPLVSYRLPPMMILRFLTRRIKGLKFHCQKFRNESRGMNELDALLANNQPVGLQTSVFFLPYFPKEMRFHFNAHNVLIYGKEKEDYLASDPIFSHVVRIDRKSLQQARFPRGALAPKGMMYYPVSVPKEIDYERLIPKAIRFTCWLNSRKNPMPFAGVNGMKTVARGIEKLESADSRYARLFLGHIFRMQEEIGTGGAGFRFMYAAFLEEASEKLGSRLLAELSKEFITVGDQWREFALMSARKGQDRASCSFKDIAEQLRKVAALEADIYDELRGLKPETRTLES